MEPSLLVDELRYIDRPHQFFEAFLPRHMPFLLQSSRTGDAYGRYSILGFEPSLVLRSKNGITTVVSHRGMAQTSTGKAGTELCGRSCFYAGDPLHLVQELVRKYCIPPLDHAPAGAAELPFTGGFVGYFGYDLNRQLERLPRYALDDQKIPDIYLAFYETVLLIDHHDHRCYAISYDKDGDTARAYRNLKKFSQSLAEATRIWRSAGAEPLAYAAASCAHGIRSNFSRDDFCRVVERALLYIHEGDIFQVNLAQRYAAELTISHFNLYKRLVAANPAPFAGYLSYPGFSILSSTPERFLYVNGDYAETRPIKGTRPRFADPGADRAAIDELLASEKDAAEHVMIVDVKRNDFGRVCQTGTVTVPELKIIESFAKVHHLVSTVTGTLKPGKDRVDLIRACFPGGSITGAPKIRAMEIIEELEPQRRNLYTGSLGYISTNDKMDLNIVIRTIVAIGSRAYLHVGGGIVADSNPVAEYRETLDKAEALFAALGVPSIE